MIERVVFDKAMYSKEAILATVYWCADRIVADVSDAGTMYSVSLSARGGNDLSRGDVEQFKAMVVHNQIRHQLSERFSDLETAIVQKAFSPVRHRQD